MIISRKKISSLVKKIKRKGLKIVFTNGCFDIIHRGHVEYLKEAKKYGDILIVGLNSDSSVRKIKGDQRPINKEKDRAVVLDSIKWVDYVVIFKEKTPLKVIKKIKPDVLVKGGDWKEEEIVGGNFVKSYGGKVKTVKYRKGFSTTSIIEKMIKLNER